MRNFICDFYKANRDKGKSFLVQNFKNLLTNEILSRSGIFKILKKYEDHESSNNYLGDPAATPEKVESLLRQKTSRKNDDMLLLHIRYGFRVMHDLIKKTIYD